MLTVQNSRLTDVDLRGLDFHGIDTAGGLAGATITPEQLSDLAPLLAADAGIEVRSV